jgi:hypothetical protein
MRAQRKLAAVSTLALAAAIGPASAASATHTGCEHERTTQAHASGPHLNEGTHTAHESIPYCPPEDAPRPR